MNPRLFNINGGSRLSKSVSGKRLMAIPFFWQKKACATMEHAVYSYELELCSGLPLRLVEASSSSSFSLMESYVLREAPLSSLTLVSPRLAARSEEHTSELQSLMRISYAVF